MTRALPKLLCLLAAALLGLEARAAEGFGLSAQAGYVPDGTMTIVGKEGSEFHYTGHQFAASVLRPHPNQYMPSYHGTYLSTMELTNRYERQDGNPDTEDPKETIKNFGLGYEVVGMVPDLGGFQVNVGVSVENAFIKVSGEEPINQRYNLGLGLKGGFGFGPLPGNSGFFLRVEYQVRYFTFGQDESDSDITLRNANFGAVVPVLGLALIAF